MTVENASALNDVTLYVSRAPLTFMTLRNFHCVCIVLCVIVSDQAQGSLWVITQERWSGHHQRGGLREGWVDRDGYTWSGCHSTHVPWKCQRLCHTPLQDPCTHMSALFSLGHLQLLTCHSLIRLHTSAHDEIDIVHNGILLSKSISETQEAVYSAVDPSLAQTFVLSCKKVCNSSVRPSVYLSLCVR